MTEAPCGKLFDGGPEVLQGHAENCEHCHAWLDGFQTCLKEQQGARTEALPLERKVIDAALAWYRWTVKCGETEASFGAESRTEWLALKALDAALSPLERK